MNPKLNNLFANTVIDELNKHFDSNLEPFKIIVEEINGDYYILFNNKYSDICYVDYTYNIFFDVKDLIEFAYKNVNFIINESIRNETITLQNSLKNYIKSNK